MLRNRHGRVLLVLLALSLVAAGVAVTVSQPGPAVAQMPPGMGNEVPPPGMAPQPPEVNPPSVQPGPGSRPGRMERMQPDRQWTMPVRAGSTSAPAVAASGEYVYVVQGDTLYQFSARTLKMVNKAELPSTSTMPERPVLPMGMGSTSPGTTPGK